LQTGVVCFVSNDLQVVSLIGTLTRVDFEIGIGNYDEKGIFS
jgi:hypothetical protein